MTTPETTGYLILGYAVFTLVMLLYLGSLILRRRSLNQDMQLLDELQRKSKDK